MKKTSPAYILLFIIAICLVFGAAVSAVHFLTLDTLRKNELVHGNRVLCNAFLLDTEGESPAALQEAIDNNIRIDTLFYENRAIVMYRHSQMAEPNVGFKFSGMGFWDRITGIVVLTPDLETIYNIQFMDQKETPGLGARIEEDWFTDQFKGLEIAWEEPVDQRILVGGSGNPNYNNRVDAITGASQTSIAVGNFLNRELALFRKAYQNRKN